MDDEVRIDESIMDRRSLLRGAALGAGGIAAAVLIGCGSDDDDTGAGDGAGSSSTATGQAVDMGDDKRGRYVKDPKLPYPYNFPEPAKEPRPGGTMVVAATWDVGPMDPTVSASGGTVTVPNMTYNRLLGIQRGPRADVFKQPVLEAELAKSWERSPDGLTFTFKMTPGIKWQNLPPLNGRPFTAADAAFALNRYAKEGVHQSYYVNVSSIQAVDDATVKITMKRPVADFLNPLGSNKQTVFPRELVDSGEITKKAIGTGPMILKEATVGQRVTFDKNPDYWERRVLLDGFEFRIVPDIAPRLAGFRAKQFDYAYALVSTQTDIKNVLTTNPDIQINMLPAVSGVAFAMNLANSKFQDERVRRALSMGMDRDTIIQIVFEGLGRVGDTIPWTFVFDQEPADLGPWTKYNPAEAKRLLAAAGVGNMTITNTYFPYNEASNRWAEVLVAQLREIGVTMNGGKADYTEFNSQWVGRKLPEVSTYGWATSGFDADNWFYGQVHSKSPGNRWNINDPQIDGWAEAQQVELNPQARRELWRKIWDRELDQAYRPPMASGYTYEVYQPWTRGIRWTGTSPGDNSSYYNWGGVVAGAWLDK